MRALNKVVASIAACVTRDPVLSEVVARIADLGSVSLKDDGESMVIDGDCVGMMDERASEASKVSSTSSLKVSGRDGDCKMRPDVDMGIGDESSSVQGLEVDELSIVVRAGDTTRGPLSPLSCRIIEVELGAGPPRLDCSITDDPGSLSKVV